MLTSRLDKFMLNLGVYSEERRQRFLQVTKNFETQNSENMMMGGIWFVKVT